jgi:TonB-linked SusC/RagA family outer membrane protein
MAALPTQSIYNADGSYSGPTEKAMWDGDIMNPIGKSTLNKNETKGYNVLGNIYAEVNLFDGLKFKSLAGIEAKIWDNRTWNPKYDWKPIAQPESYLYRQYNKSMTYLWDNYFTYNKTFDDVHKLTVLAGTSAQNNVYDNLNGSIQGFISESAQQMNNGTTDPTVGGSGSEWAILSLMARVNYAYSDKYLLTATVRRDGSSRFGANNRWGTFPSFSAAWRLSEESFFHKTDLLSDVKLRFGFGVTGNQNIDNYTFASVFQTSQYVFNGTAVSTLVPVVMPNPNVKWEEVQQTNLGVDFSFFKQQVNVTLDGYIKNTNDMLVPMSVPISTGYSDVFVPSINAGRIQNKGLELSITTQNLKGAFDWSTTFNASYNTNKILDLNSDVPMYLNTINMTNVTVQAVGHPINSFYGFVTDGIFQTQEEVDNHSVQVSGADPYNRTSAGDIKFKDLNNDGVIDDNDRTYIGNPTPDWTFAMNNTFSWKGFDLGIFFQGVAGNQILNANRIWQEGMSVAQNQTIATLNRWTGEGTSNIMPRAVFNDPNKNTRISTRFIEDGSYLRLKNLSFGYSLPNVWIEKASMSTARVYISCENLLTFTKYSGFDPEVSVTGIDNSVYPLTRTISIGANINF